jgi:short-subunit dehydrogenase
MKLNSTIALITGASSGIGAATAKAMAKKGARVALLARTESALKNVATEIAASGGEARVYPVDLTDATRVEQTIARIKFEMGEVDVVVNSAGAGRWLFTEETSPAEAVDMMAVPYFAAFNVTRFCLPSMLKRRRGHIVVVNSPVVLSAWPGAAGYTAARYALLGFTNALRFDLRGTGVNVTSIVPGKVADSEYFQRNKGVEERIPAIGKIIPAVTSAQVAKATVQGVEGDKREVVLPFMLKMFFAANHFFPWLMEWLLAATGWQRR